MPLAYYCTAVGCDFVAGVLDDCTRHVVATGHPLPSPTFVPHAGTAGARRRVHCFACAAPIDVDAGAAVPELCTSCAADRVTPAP